MVVCVGLAGVCLADSERPTAMELLDKYATTQDKIYKSFIMKFEASIDGYRSFTYKLEAGKRKGGFGVFSYKLFVMMPTDSGFDSNALSSGPAILFKIISDTTDGINTTIT